MVTPEQEVVECAPTDYAAHLQEFRYHEENDEPEHRVAQQGQAEIVKARALEAVREAEDQTVQGEAGDDRPGEQAGAEQNRAAEAQPPQPGTPRILHVEQIQRGEHRPIVSPLRAPCSNSATSYGNSKIRLNSQEMAMPIAAPIAVTTATI